MNTITHNQRYLPHEISTKYHSVKIYRSGYSVSFVCRRYKISHQTVQIDKNYFYVVALDNYLLNNIYLVVLRKKIHRAKYNSRNVKF